jgi:hypothetical protein
LDNRKCHTTGTIISGRVGNPKPVRKGAMKKMESGDTLAYRRGNVLLMSWKDNRMVLMMSTYQVTSMGKIVSIQNGGIRKKFKRQCIQSICVVQIAVIFTAQHTLLFVNL